MPIRIICENRHHRGELDIIYPAFFCDVCRERIDDAGKGNVYYRMKFTDEGVSKDMFYEERREPFFAHYECDQRADRVVGGHTWWMTLEDFILDLGFFASMQISVDSLKRTRGRKSREGLRKPRRKPAS